MVFLYGKNINGRENTDNFPRLNPISSTTGYLFSRSKYLSFFKKWVSDSKISYLFRTLHKIISQYFIKFGGEEIQTGGEWVSWLAAKKTNKKKRISYDCEFSSVVMKSRLTRPTNTDRLGDWRCLNWQKKTIREMFRLSFSPGGRRIMALFWVGFDEHADKHTHALRISGICCCLFPTLNEKASKLH